MATRFHIVKPLVVALAWLATMSLIAAVPHTAQAHQLQSTNGATLPHHHLYRRSSYGNGYQTGHVAPTPHGNNMIIWSPAPSNSYGNSVPQVQIVKPNRHGVQQRALPKTEQRREANPRPDRP
jgi:hypothetical protein